MHSNRGTNNCSFVLLHCWRNPSQTSLIPPWVPEGIFSSAVQQVPQALPNQGKNLNDDIFLNLIALASVFAFLSVFFFNQKGV